MEVPEKELSSQEQDHNGYRLSDQASPQANEPTTDQNDNRQGFFLDFSQRNPDVILNWIKTKAPGASFKDGLQLIGLDVADGQTLRNERNHPGSNPANVFVVMDLVEFLLSRGALSEVSCAIITTYSEQKKEYVGKMMSLSERLNIFWGDMVKVATVDSMQGHEADIVILDWVVDSGTKPDLGFASDNRRANVALTRARSCLIAVANGNIINNDRLSETRPMEIQPEILVYWKYLLDKDMIVNCPAHLGTTDIRWCLGWKPSW